MKPHRKDPEGWAFCPDCQTLKPVAQVPTNASMKKGRGTYCLPCHNVRTRENVIKNHGSPRGKHLKRRYGLTEADVDAMLEAQGGLCAICRRKPAEHVDHCHLTGQVRGLLCFTCNVGLGNFGDSEHLMRLAADYVRGHQTTDPAVLEELLDGADFDDLDWTTGA